MNTTEDYISDKEVILLHPGAALQERKAVMEELAGIEDLGTRPLALLIKMVLSPESELLLKEELKLLTEPYLQKEAHLNVLSEQESLVQAIINTKFPDASDTVVPPQDIALILKDLVKKPPDLEESLSALSHKTLEVVLEKIQEQKTLASTEFDQAKTSLVKEKLYLTFQQNPDDYQELRQTAITKLGEIHAENALLPLLTVVDNPKELRATRIAALESIGKIGEHIRSEEWQQQPRKNPETVKAIVQVENTLLWQNAFERDSQVQRKVLETIEQATGLETNKNVVMARSRQGSNSRHVL